MLRRLTSILSLISLLTVSLAPTTFAASTVGKQSNKAALKKIAPELESVSGSTNTVRVVIQTKGRPTAAHASALAGVGGVKGRDYEALDATYSGEGGSVCRCRAAFGLNHNPYRIR